MAQDHSKHTPLNLLTYRISWSSTRHNRCRLVCGRLHTSRRL